MVKPKIKVVSSIMGSGKTTWAIQRMNSRPDDRFIYISPLLSELKRIRKDCPDLDFAEPLREGYDSKGCDLKKLLRGGDGDEAILDLVRSVWRDRADRYSEERHEAMTSARGYSSKARKKMEMITLGG